MKPYDEYMKEIADILIEQYTQITMTKIDSLNKQYSETYGDKKSESNISRIEADWEIIKKGTQFANIKAFISLENGVFILNKEIIGKKAQKNALKILL